MSEYKGQVVDGLMHGHGKMKCTFRARRRARGGRGTGAAGR